MIFSGASPLLYADDWWVVKWYREVRGNAVQFIFKVEEISYGKENNDNSKV